MEKPPVQSDKDELRKLIMEKTKEPGMATIRLSEGEGEKIIFDAMQKINEYGKEGKLADPYKNHKGIPNGVRVRPEKSATERIIEDKLR